MKVVLGRIVDSFGHRCFTVTVKADTIESEEASCKALKGVLVNLLRDSIFKDAFEVVVEKGDGEA